MLCSVITIKSVWFLNWSETPTLDVDATRMMKNFQYKNYKKYENWKPILEIDNWWLLISQSLQCHEKILHEHRIPQKFKNDPLPSI